MVRLEPVKKDVFNEFVDKVEPWIFVTYTSFVLILDAVRLDNIIELPINVDVILPSNNVEIDKLERFDVFPIILERDKDDTFNVDVWIEDTVKIEETCKVDVIMDDVNSDKTDNGFTVNVDAVKLDTFKELVKMDDTTEEETMALFPTIVLTPTKEDILEVDIVTLFSIRFWPWIEETIVEFTCNEEVSKDEYWKVFATIEDIIPEDRFMTFPLRLDTSNVEIDAVDASIINVDNDDTLNVLKIILEITIEDAMTDLVTREDTMIEDGVWMERTNPEEMVISNVLTFPVWILDTSKEDA